MKRIMILSKDFSHSGGVANYVKVLMQALKGKHEFIHYRQGLTSKNHNHLIVPFVYLHQVLTFKGRIREDEPDVVHINTSLKWVSMLTLALVSPSVLV